jgi:hypothetical protein
MVVVGLHRVPARRGTKSAMRAGEEERVEGALDRVLDGVVQLGRVVWLPGVLAQRGRKKFKDRTLRAVSSLVEV